MDLAPIVESKPLEMNRKENNNSYIKYIALFALLLQNAGLTLIMRYSLVVSAPDGKYITSTAVLSAECMKLFIATLACYFFDGNGQYRKFINVLKVDGSSKVEWLKLSVPSVLYTVQNTLQYVAMGLLSAPVFQVTYQMKIITTAIFSVLILNRAIGTSQWIAIVVLAIGVGIVQVSQINEENTEQKDDSILGLIAVGIGCVTSGFAGVYFELVLKSTKASIWLRNMQLACIGIVMASVACYYNNYEDIRDRGFFVGYTEVVWTVIFFQAAGGLIVAMVVKYADNVIKNFATAFSIVLSAVISYWLFQDVQLNLMFLLGASSVIGSVYVFNLAVSKRAVSKADLEVSMDKDEDVRDMLLSSKNIEQADGSPSHISHNKA